MRTLAIVGVVAGCSGKADDDDGIDSGDGGVCGALTATTQGLAPYEDPNPCPFGGTVDDLVPSAVVLDPAGQPCVVCEGGTDLTALVTVSNGCPVDVTYPGDWGIASYSVTSATDAASMTGTSCTTSPDVTVPANSAISFDSRIIQDLAEGVWTGTFDLCGLDRDAVARFCVDMSE